jgi:antitoxin component YwqK of YwqJK toxin-antitoxin module
MKKFLLTLVICMLSIFSFASEVIEIEKYENGNTKYEVISHPTVDGDIFEYNAYYENGSFMISGMYNEYGRKSGFWSTYYENGQIESRIFYSNGIRNGKGLYYDVDGSVLAQDEYRYGKKHGIWAQYSEDGKLLCQREYKRDKKHGTWKQFNDDGKMLLATDEYKRGKLIEGWSWSESQGLIARYP